MHKAILLIQFFIVSQCIHAQLSIHFIEPKNIVNNTGYKLSDINWRGLSVVNDKTIWVSGSKGMVALSNDGGKIFKIMQVNACSTCDFRDIEAFDDKQAIIINSGYPAIIYKTNDGGNSWQEVFRKNDSSYFLDAMDFWDNKRGLILADPIDGRFVLLKTEDGGQNWQHVESDMCPKAFEGEAVFAASGTSLRCWGKNSFAFVSGGSQTRLFLFEKGLTKHAYFHVPFVSGKNTQGAFGLSKPFQGNLIAVCGGDYTDANGDNTAFAIFSFKKPKWYGSKSVEPITGYKSCVEFIGNNYLIICGTNGVEWVQQKNNYFSNAEISGKSFNTIAKAKKGNSVYLAGTKGTIALIVRGKTHHHSTKQ